MKRMVIVIMTATVLLLAGCSLNTPEIRDAAYCKPLSEYETYETIIVHSIEEIPSD